MKNIIILEQNLIDLSIISTSAKMLLELDNILESQDFNGKTFSINLGDVSFTSAHMSALKSLITEAGAEIKLIITKSVNTQLAALEAGLAVSENLPEKNAQLSSEKESDDAFELEQSENAIFDELKEEMTASNSAETSKLDNNIEKSVEITENKETLKAEINKKSNDTEKALEEFLESEASNQEANIEEAPKKKNENISENTLYIKQTLRSGKTVNFDGNVFIIGDCHPGSEIIATGDINVWGVLSGIAHAGSTGNKNAAIRALRINAIQLRIADMFSRKPDRLLIEKQEKTHTFTPEEAKIEHGEIKIFSYNY